MKLRLFLVLSGLLAVTQLASAAKGRQAVIGQDSRINVQFVEPENFTDVRDSYTSTTDHHRAWVLGEVRKFLQKRGELALREDLHLTVRITDIDLAGDFEPWRFRFNDDIRIVKDIYPTRIKLEFQLVDSAGNVVAEGERKLTDFGHLTTFSPSSDSLRFEKEVLRDWLSREFREYRKA